jgi:hypothetical protein
MVNKSFPIFGYGIKIQGQNIDLLEKILSFVSTGDHGHIIQV